MLLRQNCNGLFRSSKFDANTFNVNTLGFLKKKENHVFPLAFDVEQHKGQPISF